MSLHWSNATHVLCSQPILSKLAQSVLANDLQHRNIHLVRCHPPNRPPCARTGTRTALHCKARRKPTPSSNEGEMLAQGQIDSLVHNTLVKPAGKGVFECKYAT
jgi:hypothetical protein